MDSFLDSSFHSISLVICSYAIVVILCYLNFVVSFEFRVLRFLALFIFMIMPFHKNMRILGNLSVSKYKFGDGGCHTIYNISFQEIITLNIV